MPGCASASLATISATFFEGVLFLGARGLRVARSWLLDRPADRLQGFPATLRGELFQAQLIGHPACDLGARPKSAIGRRFAQTDTKPFQQLRLQNRRNATVVSSLISQRCGSERVVAFEQLFDPALPERSDISDLARRMPLRQQKNRLKMPQRRHVLAALATRLQLRNAQMVDDPSHVRLPRIMALPSIILIPPPESPSSSQSPGNRMTPVRGMGFDILIRSGRTRSQNLDTHAAAAASFNPARRVAISGSWYKPRASPLWRGAASTQGPARSE